MDGVTTLGFSKPPVGNNNIVAFMQTSLPHIGGNSPTCFISHLYRHDDV